MYNMNNNPDFNIFVNNFKQLSGIEQVMYLDLFIDDEDTKLKQLYILNTYKLWKKSLY